MSEENKTTVRTSRSCLLAWARQTLQKELQMEFVTIEEMASPTPEMRTHMLNIFGLYNNEPDPEKEFLLAGLKAHWEKISYNAELVFVEEDSPVVMFPFPVLPPAPPPSAWSTPPPETARTSRRERYIDLEGVNLDRRERFHAVETIRSSSSGVTVSRSTFDDIIADIRSDRPHLRGDDFIEAVADRIKSEICNNISDYESDSEFETYDSDTNQGDCMESETSAAFNTSELESSITTHIRQIADQEIIDVMNNAVDEDEDEEEEDSEESTI